MDTITQLIENAKSQYRLLIQAGEVQGEDYNKLYYDTAFEISLRTKTFKEFKEKARELSLAFDEVYADECSEAL